MTQTVAIEQPKTLLVRSFLEPPKELYMSAEINRDMPVFLRLYNPDNIFIGQISFNHCGYMKKLHIGPGRASLNAMVLPLTAGNYRVEIYVYDAISDEIISEVKVTLTDEVLEGIPEDEYQDCQWFSKDGALLKHEIMVDERSRFYKGDFHSHTTLSDGQVRPEEVDRYLQIKGLDFTAMTEHNFVPFGFRKTSQLMIPSFELTLPVGHINIHGLAQPDLLEVAGGSVPDFPRELNPYLKSWGDNVNISINHMFMEPWDFTYSNLDLGLVNTIEVICDPTYPTAPQANDRAVAFLDFLWNQGQRIWGIGGSDSHNRQEDHYKGSDLPSVYGDPATYVFCDGLSAGHVLSGIKKGHAYVSRFFDLDLKIGHKNLLPGSVLDESVPDFYSVTLKPVHTYTKGKTFTGRFILNGQVIKEQELTEDAPLMVLEGLRDKMADRKWCWMRFGLYDQEGHAVAYVNPIYKGNMARDEQTLGYYIEEFLRT